MERLKKIDWSNLIDNVGLTLIVLGAVIILLLITYTAFIFVYDFWLGFNTGTRIGILAFVMIAFGTLFTQVAKLVKRE